MTDFRKQWNEACLQVGLPSLTLNTCAKIAAIIYNYDNEQMSHCNKLMADLGYIMERYRIFGGQMPCVDFAEVFKEVNDELKNLKKPPQWAKDLMKNMYNIDIY